MNYRNQALKYITSDLLSAAVAWTLFFVYRKTNIEPLKFGYEVPINFDTKYIIGVITIPLFWLTLYYVTGHYKEVFRRSRLHEFGQTFFTSLFGIVIIFFTILLDDNIYSYKNYYALFGVLFLLHFTITYIPRLFITINTYKKFESRKWGINTLIIGSSNQAVDTFLDIENQQTSTGNRFVGFVSVKDTPEYQLAKHLTHLGKHTNLVDIISKHKIKEIIIAIETKEHEEIGNIINLLYNQNVVIKVIPDMYDILMGKVKMSTIFGTPLILISHDIMPFWQQMVKQIIDYVVAFVLLLLLFPFIIAIIISIKLTSKGPIIYKHERIGRFGKPFTIYKFRSMYIDAEKDGPALSSKNDTRITPFGRFMRKSRLDEIPNFVNVLKGEMSLVGPRPERQFFIDQILPKAPHYVHLQKVKPGITSWGQVKYGYAENVDQMIERLKYDILYLENMSLFVDFKILIYTALTIIQRKGI